jgi:hypothetical protein
MKSLISAKKASIHILFFLILAYAYQDYLTSTNLGVLEADRGLVHMTLFIVLSLLGLFFVVSIKSKKILKDKVTTTFWLITLWIFFVGLIQGATIWPLLVHLGLSLLWILIYHFGKNYSALNNSTKMLTIKWIVVVFFFYFFSVIYAAYNITVTYGRTPVINLVYYVLVFYPWISFVPIKRLKQFLNILIAVTVLFSFKRGAIIIYPLMLVTNLVVKAKIENRKIAGFGKTVLLSFLFICALLIVDNQTGGFILNRFTIESLETGSGRADLYSLAISNIKSRSFFDLMIGLGSGSSVQFLETGVHNEWLEFLFSFGIIGVIMYAILFISLIRRGMVYINERTKYAPAYFSILVYMMVIGLFGGLYFVHSTMYIMLFLGTIEGLRINKKKFQKDSLL